ncbi:MAG: AAA family ATPase [Candidatus Levybacteria bacterium]|nr:AAA family ATPase [Candidatus Levybacteria bacterium]
MANTKRILAFVGMPGSGKSEAAHYLQEKGFAYIRFGDLTDEGLREKGLPLTPENEKHYREEIRENEGMDVYAKRATPKIQTILETEDNVIIDGLYAWEEYTFLDKQFQGMIVVYVFTEPHIRYQRLSARLVRPLTHDEARLRDFAEIELLNKSGPIAIADYLIENNGSLEDLHQKIDSLLSRIKLIPQQ